MWRNWDTASALDGRYWVFGIVLLAEAVLIGGGCLVLARRRATRWYRWWIGLCVAVHFVPLAWEFGDWSYLLLAAVQVVGLLAMRPGLAASDYATSRWTAPWSGATFLAYASLSGVVFLTGNGYPF
ncbi:hypothetical protein [Brevibacterium aurantiacum]|uniref:hypothetical protein n=1 Tax=Brevibacterium aurantiacum TaxID=273384 RepID=UPI001866755E|nr:hypothetical protein [Brevibacterium aurantiacum]